MNIKQIAGITIIEDLLTKDEVKIILQLDILILVKMYFLQKEILEYPKQNTKISFCLMTIVFLIKIFLKFI